MYRPILTLALCLFLAACAPHASADAPAAQTTAPITQVAIAIRISASTPVPPGPTPTLASATQTPTRAFTRTPSATPTADLPAQAEVKGMYGYGQLLALSCEARAAADWARHFGITIHELDFLKRLPRSQDPEEGFVGNINGTWGQIPPQSYGVHAAPIAHVLRSYGAQAVAERNLSFDRLRAEIAAGRPVIVWVTGHVEKGKPSEYHVNEKIVRVAAYEHTVIVIGYTAKAVTILDGKTVYEREVKTFLDSWGVLENMAVIWEDAPQRGQPSAQTAD